MNTNTHYLPAILSNIITKYQDLFAGAEVLQVGDVFTTFKTFFEYYRLEVCYNVSPPSL